MAVKFEAEVKCFFCGISADRIGYYRKRYPNNKTTIENPQPCCETCLKTHRNDFHQHRGGDEEVTSILFANLPKLPKEKLGMLFSMKGKEVNHFKSPYWKKLIWRMYYLAKPQKEVTP